MFTNVLVGVDGEQGGRDAIALATRLAGRDSKMTLAHIYSAGLMRGRGAATLPASELQDARRLLERERNTESLDAQLAPCAEDSVGRGLHELAEREQADLLVVGSSRRGLLGRVLIGNGTINALNGAPCAVAIAPRGYAATAYRSSTIGVGCDGSPESQEALVVARELAARENSTIKAMSVVALQSIPYGEPIHENWPDVAKQLMDKEGRRPHGLEDIEGDVSYGEPGEELAHFGQELDLLIVGSRGYGPLGRLFHGSVSSYLVGHAPCPLLVLPRGASSEIEPDEAEHDAETSTAAV